ncbi:MAG TPA: cysteine hydrolase family protein [Ktedonobacteraceae bacterium]|jgi:nicotinamidase-related amidase|nr:cysteine hydrolase family protein [Ktedonobacteraceae bacterium]
MKPALIVIDVQNEYFAPHGQWILPDGLAALTHIQELLSAFRQHRLPIFHIQHESPAPDAPVFRKGSPGREVHPEISILPGEKQIVKRVPGAFYQTSLEEDLLAVQADTLIICGYMTHMCCDTTTRQASERGLRVLFATDATATLDLKLNDKVIPHQIVHETTLAIMTRFASILPTTEIIKTITQ